ncbi:tetratricopeptide repeat protein [Olivibacter sp. XZL3]|uniref:tetratricopeptide repeat protein n=1 Tax=Olivibacter sp. XZL3 TaxID=1735116 RepID=UPI001066757B|nr:tetratricopeptide repeat protein [Olivibacter sp. XZL3]
MTRRLILFLLLSFSLIPYTYASFEFTTNCKQAYTEILNLRLDVAQQYLEKEREANPENRLIPLLENYVDYFRILSSDDKSLFDKLKKNKSARLSKISEGSKESPYYLFAQAEINLQWALVRGKYQEYVASALEIKKAYNMLNENLEKYPDFLPNKKGLGMVNALIGSLPSSAQKALGTLGVRGSTERGEKMLEGLVEDLPKSPYKMFYDESVFYLMQVWVNITKKKQAFEAIYVLTDPMEDTSLLKLYMRAFTAFKTGHNDEAIKHLSSRPKDADYVDYPYLDYLLGMAKLHKLDFSAVTDFQRFLNGSNGGSYVKDAYLHLAYISLLKGDSAAYKTYCSKVKVEGTTYDEKDKQALSEVDEGIPNISLLKARFLFDGGYYKRAKDLLAKENANSYKQKRDKIEYCYRFARVFHETGGVNGAIKFYQYTIAFGKDAKYYYAANAALFLGDIYVAKKQYKTASSYYHKAIDMKNHDYESSIENKAKEALKRMEGKY